MFTVDVEMNRVFARLLTLTLTAVAISLGSVAIFVLPQRVASALEEHPQGQDRVPSDSPTKSRFLSALKAYKAQRYTAAEGELEPLVKSAPDNFEVNELLGLVYVAQDKQVEANRFLRKAVQLKPNVMEARTALATNLLALRRENEAELQFKKIVALEPQSYDANHNLGEFYIQTGKVANAIPFLKRAQEIDPAAYNNGYDLALALEHSLRQNITRQLVARFRGTSQPPGRSRGKVARVSHLCQTVRASGAYGAQRTERPQLGCGAPPASDVCARNRSVSGRNATLSTICTTAQWAGYCILWRRSTG